MTDHRQSLLTKIITRQATVAVIGLVPSTGFRAASPRDRTGPSTELRTGPSTGLRATSPWDCAASPRDRIGPSTELRTGPSTGLRAASPWDRTDYVGLPLAVELAQAGFRTLVLDSDRGRVEAINVGRSYHPAVSSVEILTGLRTGKLSAHLAAEYDRLRQCEAIAICLPAPLPQRGDPDPAALVATVEAISDYLHPGLLLLLNGPAQLDLVQEILHPYLVRHSLVLGQDLFVACWPGRLEAGLLPQPRELLEGVTTACTELARAWYNLLVPAEQPQRSLAAREPKPDRA